MSMSSGPSRGRTGREWSYSPNGRISKIKLYYGKVIYAISFCSVDGAGKITWSKTFGERFSDYKPTTISIRYPDEKLTDIQGTRHTLHKGAPWVITSLTFTTNLSSYGPFGRVTGTEFNFPNLSGKIITNFNGRALDCLYAIGIKFIQCRDSDVVKMSDGEMLASEFENGDDMSNGKKRQKTEVGVTPTKSEKAIQTLLQVFEQKIRALNDLVHGKSVNVTESSTFGSPISSLKGKISAIVCGGLEKLSSNRVADLEPLYLDIIEKKTRFSEVDKLFMLKLKVAMELMKEVKRLGEMKNMLKEQEAEFKQEYARRDEYFTSLKKSIDRMIEMKNDDLYNSGNLGIPTEFLNSSMSALLTKFQQKAQKMIKLKEQIGALETKKKFALDLLVTLAIG